MPPWPPRIRSRFAPGKTTRPARAIIGIMTPDEFVIWLRGFVAASHHFNLTPAGWDELKRQLEMVRTDKGAEQ